MKKQLKAPYEVSATRLGGLVIEWSFDTHQSAWRFWRKLKETREFPDTGDPCVSAKFRDNSCELDAFDDKTATVLAFKR